MDDLQQLRQEEVRQCRAASERFAEHSDDLEANRQKQRDGQSVVGTPEELEARAGRLMRAGELPVGAVIEAAQDERSRPALLERVIGSSTDFLASSFLARGARASARVARISLLSGGRELPLGTGFLVSPRLLMTNNHVLPDPSIAGRVAVEFGAEVSIDNQPLVPSPHSLDPESLFLTDPELDFSLVAVLPGAGGQHPGEVFGWCRLIAEQGKILVGEAINVIGHPMGRRKEIAIRNNKLEVQLPRFLHYSTDTERGSSGSPVFNDQWEVIALHHCGVARVDDQNRVLRRDGGLWQKGDGEDTVAWTANEGARVSVILEHLRGLDVSPEKRALLAEMGAEAGLGVSAPPSLGGPVSDGDGLEAAVGRRGASARAGALRGNHLVLLHGRGQQGEDPIGMRVKWTAALNHGMTLAGSGTIDPADVWFPFYGDRFVEAVQSDEGALVVPAAVAMAVETAADLTPTPPTTRALYETLVEQTAAAAGMPSSDVPPESDGPFAGLRGFVISKLQRQLSWIAARSGLDTFVVARILRDVAAYLDQDRVRRTVLDAVRETMPQSGRLVIVSHSLGTVVAMDLIAELPPEADVALLVTAGSPLGLDAVYTRLLIGGPKRPARIGRWLNTWCPADPVSIGCPLGDDWGDEIDEITADNPKDRAHDITEYLADSVLADTVAKSLNQAT